MGASNEEGRVIVVTGANAGIGKEVVRQLAEQGHQVVAVSRSREKGARAVDEIQAAVPAAKIDLVQGGLSTIAGVRALAQMLLAQYPRIHVLINNAGVWMTKRELNADGLEMTYMVNHMAPFLLSNLLLDRLKESAPARIVNVNAGLYAMGEANLEKVPTGENFHRFKTYMHSKMCNMLATLELARRIEGSGVTVNALHPGVIRTNLGVSAGPLGWLIRAIKLFWTSPEEGAKPVVRLATDPALEGVSGKYFEIYQEKPVTEAAQDRELAKRLWVLGESTAGE